MLNSKATWILLFTCLFALVALQAQDMDLLNRKITLNVEDGALSNVLTTMADLSETNIVLAIPQISDEDKAVEQRVTIHLSDVPIEQALSLVVKSVGLSYRLIGDNTFLVGARDLIEEEVGERSYVIRLNYLDVEVVVDALDIMPGDAVALPAQNSILLRANPETYSEIAKRIEEIDIPQKQIEIRARLIEISIDDSKKLGIDWSRLNSLTTILAEDPMTADGFGLPYAYTDATSNLTHGDTQTLGVLPDGQYFQKMDDWENFGHFSRQLYAFDVTIDWLLQNNAAQLLTDTRLTALNGEEASILIGEIIPFVVRDMDNDFAVEREEVGIKLTVVPKINAAGLITTRIAPEVSSVVELVNGSVPRTKTREVETTVTVPNGSKIIVGGLLSNQLITTTSKVPFLGDLPFIGGFFTHNVETMRTTDLIIEITPRVVNLGEEQASFEIDERLETRLLHETE
ncbi:MAG: hypothetical protein K8R90_08960 [Candidatus Cloacimonetes bacterium]|nr:hypothetical protein [Candidatus Cloacimonadota bacterium]